MTTEKKKRTPKPAMNRGVAVIVPLLTLPADAPLQDLLAAGEIALTLATGDLPEDLREWLVLGTKEWNSPDTETKLRKISRMGQAMVGFSYGTVKRFENRAVYHEIVDTIQQIRLNLLLGHGTMVLMPFFSGEPPKSGWLDESFEAGSLAKAVGDRIIRTPAQFVKTRLYQLERAFPYYLAKEWETLSFYVGACPRCGKVFEKKQANAEYCSKSCANMDSRDRKK